MADVTLVDDELARALGVVLERVVAPHVEAAVARALARHQAAQPAPDRRRCTVAEAADEARVSERTIRRWLATGKLRGVSTGDGGSSRVLVLRSSLDEVIGGSR